MKERYIQKIKEAIGEKRLANLSHLLVQISEEYAHVYTNYQEAQKSVSTGDRLNPLGKRETKRKIEELRLACNKRATSYYGMITELKKEIQTCAENQMPFKLKFSIQELTKAAENITISEHMSNRELGTILRRARITGLDKMHTDIEQVKKILSEELGNSYEDCPEREVLIDWVLTDFLEEHKLPDRLEKFF